MPEGLAHLGTPVTFWAFSHYPGNGFPQEVWVLFLLSGLWVHYGCLWPGGVHAKVLLFLQLGLLVDFSTDGLMIPEDGINNEELEAEFLALVGGQPQALEKLKGKGETFNPPPPEHFLSSGCRQRPGLGVGEMKGNRRSLLEPTVWVKG